jgi:hypothetical protein
LRWDASPGKEIRIASTFAVAGASGMSRNIIQQGEQSMKGTHFLRHLGGVAAMAAISLPAFAQGAGFHVPTFDGTYLGTVQCDGISNQAAPTPFKTTNNVTVTLANDTANVCGRWDAHQFPIFYEAPIYVRDAKYARGTIGFATSTRGYENGSALGAYYIGYSEVGQGTFQKDFSNTILLDAISTVLSDQLLSPNAPYAPYSLTCTWKLKKVAVPPATPCNPPI